MKQKGKGSFSPVGHGDSEKEGKRVGQGNFANMPQDVSMKAYPKGHEFGSGNLDDTMSEIDMTTKKAHSTSRKHLSNQH